MPQTVCHPAAGRVALPDIAPSSGRESDARDGLSAVYAPALPLIGSAVGRSGIGLRVPRSPARGFSAALGSLGDPASRDESCDVRRSYSRIRPRGGLLMRSVTYSMGISLDG